MADRVHPTDSSTLDVPPPPPATYVIQIPKDQIYRHPPPENALRYKGLSRPKTGRSFCCRCCCLTLCFLLLLIVAGGVLYLIFRPESPDYSVLDVAIKGVNLTSSGPISPEFDVSVRANNPDDKIGIYYERGSEVKIRNGDIELANGALPVFYQPSNNMTVFPVGLKSRNVLLGNGVKSRLRSQQKQGKVPFVLKLRVPVKMKIGSVKTWEITVKVNCELTVDSLTEKSRIVSKDCDYDVRLW